MANAYLSPLNKQVVGELVTQARLSTLSNDPDEFLASFVELLMMEWNGQLVEKYRKAGIRDRRDRKDDA